MSTSASAPSPQMPCCIICGDNFVADNELDSNASTPRIFDERPEWKASLEKHGYVACKIADFQNYYFTIPWLWKCIVRGIVYNSDTKQCKLSGAGTTGSFLTLPKQRDDLVMMGNINLAHRESKQLKSMYLGVMRQRSPHESDFCYMIHERCWELANRVLDPHLIEDKMRFLEAAMSTGNRIAGFTDMGGKYDDEAEWKKHKKSTDGNLDARDPAAFVAQYSKDWRCDEKKHALRDPWKVIDVWKSIEAEMVMFREEQQTERVCIREMNSKMGALKLDVDTSNLAKNVPAEIVLDILDLLPDSRQIRKLMWAFPHWAVRVPFSYWRKRFIVDFLLEDEEEIPDSAALNWRRLYYKAGRIHRGSHGLQNRRRILRHLDKVNAAHLEALSRNKSK